MQNLTQVYYLIKGQPQLFVKYLQVCHAREINLDRDDMLIKLMMWYTHRTYHLRCKTDTFIYITDYII